MAAQTVVALPRHFDSVPLPGTSRRDPGPDEVEIQVEACALNFKDVLIGLGLMPAMSEGAPALGLECAGTVAKVGARVAGFEAGDAVVAVGAGCLASSVTLPSGSVARRPAHLSPAQAVTLPVAFITASYALEELARLRSGDRILIHAATGGVGMAALQLARRTGAEIFATAGSEEKRRYLRDLGASHVMNSRTPDFAAEILAATHGEGVDVVLNSLSGDLMLRSLEVLAPHGRFVELGARDAIAGNSLSLSLLRRGGSFCFVGYDAPIPRMGDRLREIMARAASQEIEPLPMRVFRGEDARSALEFLASAKHIGKVVIAIRDAPSGGVGKNPAGAEDLLRPAEGGRLFELCLGGGRANFAVSKRPLAARIAGEASRSKPTAAQPEARACHPRPQLSAPYVEPGNEIERGIAAIWAKHFELDSVGINDDFFDLGGDSLLAVQLSHSMRSSLAVDVTAHLILENPTISELARRLDRAPSRPDASRHLVQLAKGPAGVRPIFLVHPIGGHVYFYLPMAGQLGSFAPVYGLQAQGVDGEAPPLETIEEMASGYIAAMRGVQPRGPYRIGGASFGGVVCFEMAHQLAAVGESLELLALIDSPAPSSLTSFFHSDAEILAYLLAKGESPEGHLRELSSMSEERMLRYFLGHGGAGGRLASNATVESVRHFLRLFRANYDALVRYRPRRYGSSGLFFHATSHDAFNTQGFEPEWRSCFPELELIPVPGNHTSMNLPPNCDGMVRRIRMALAND
jgi:NADPH:quinone reductase-like Zn-dependent oxidoreductase/thioesterase domain-containing protein